MYDLGSVQCSAESDQIPYISLYDLYGLGIYELRYMSYDFDEVQYSLFNIYFNNNEFSTRNREC